MYYLYVCVCMCVCRSWDWLWGQKQKHCPSHRCTLWPRAHHHSTHQTRSKHSQVSKSGHLSTFPLNVIHAVLFSFCHQKCTHALALHVLRWLAFCLQCFQERHSWNVPPTPDSSQWLLRLLQEAAVLRYINADTIIATRITELTS